MEKERKGRKNGGGGPGDSYLRRTNPTKNDSRRVKTCKLRNEEQSGVEEEGGLREGDKVIEMQMDFKRYASCGCGLPNNRTVTGPQFETFGAAHLCVPACLT